MADTFEQPAKMMGQAYEQWRKVMVNNPLINGLAVDEWKKNTATWLSRVKDSYQSNAAAWDKFLDQFRDSYFEALKNSPFYDQSGESVIRNAWNDMEKARKKYQEAVKESLEKIDSTLRDAVETDKQ